MKKAISVVITLAVIVTALAAAGCGGAETPADQVTFQLKWIHQAQFAGVYAADQKGFYDDENIDVILKAGGADLIPDMMIADLVSGETDFAIVGGEQVISYRALNESIVAIAVIFQINPYVYATLKDSGIENPQDLVGKKVMVSPNGEMLHEALLTKLGIDPDTVERIPYERSATPLGTGQIDANMVYRTAGGLLFEEAGYEVDFIWLDNYGIHFYADIIVTTEQIVQEKPDLVEGFLRATLKGWQYAIEHQEEAVDMTLQYDPILGREHQTLMMEIQAPLIHTGKSEMGWMEDSVWQGMHQILLDGGILDQPIDLSEAYTMQFLNEIYGVEE